MDQDLRRLERAAKTGGPADMTAWLSALCRIGQHHGVHAGLPGAWDAAGYLLAQPVCSQCAAQLDPGPAMDAWRRGGQEGAKDCGVTRGRAADQPPVRLSVRQRSLHGTLAERRTLSEPP